MNKDEFNDVSSKIGTVMQEMINAARDDKKPMFAILITAGATDTHAGLAMQIVGASRALAVETLKVVLRREEQQREAHGPKKDGTH